MEEKEKLKNYFNNTLDVQTLAQLNNIKAFVDGTIKDVIFEDKTKDEKLYYLIDSLIQLHDFISSKFTENSIKNNLKKTVDEALKEEEISEEDAVEELSDDESDEFILKEENIIEEDNNDIE